MRSETKAKHQVGYKLKLPKSGRVSRVKIHVNNQCQNPITYASAKC